MTTTHSSSRRVALAALVVALLTAAALAPSTVFAGARAKRASGPRAHAAARLLTGVGNEYAGMFRNGYWIQLHTKIVRYIAPYDAVVHRASLNKAITFIQGAEATHQQVLVAFYHSEYTPTVLPSVAQYQHDVAKFIKIFKNVHQYQAWDESNRGNVAHFFSSPSAGATARYYQALRRVCTNRCTVIGLDVLDAQNITGTLEYISEFKREIGHLHTVMPSIWGLHDYSDVNRFESWRTREIVRALGGQVWLTETGGIVQFGGAFPNHNGSGTVRAAKVLKYMFAVAHSVPHIARLYIYDWTGGYSRARPFDAGLTNPHEQPRSGYEVVCKALHATGCAVARLAKN